MVAEKKPAPKKGPAYVPAAAPGWHCTPNRSLYVSKDGAIARWVNQSSCAGCMRKYQIRHPNLKVADKLVRAGGSLKGAKLDLHVCGKAMELLAKAPPADFITAAPMKMCVKCGNMATLAAACDCGNTMADKNGQVLINVSQYEQDGSRVRASLNMPGYPKTRIVFPKDKIKATDLITIRESEAETIAITVDAGLLKNQILRSTEK